jgi:hypothetical protein
LKRAHVPEFTACYRDSYRSHYLNMGEEPPDGATSTENLLEAIARWDAEGLPPFKRFFQIRRLK